MCAFNVRGLEKYIKKVSIQYVVEVSQTAGTAGEA
jgi:hypothetical protein